MACSRISTVSRRTVTVEETVDDGPQSTEARSPPAQQRARRIVEAPPVSGYQSENRAGRSLSSLEWNDSFHDSPDEFLAWLLDHENMHDSSGSLTTHYNITARQRARVVKEMKRIKKRKNLSLETLHLAVYLLDRFLKLTPFVARDELSLVGRTCINIAMDQDEIYALMARFPGTRIMKGRILTKIGHDINVRCAPTFLTVLRQIYFDERRLFVLERRHRQVIKIGDACLRKTLTDYGFMQHKSSVRAAVALIRSLRIAARGLHRSLDADCRRLAGMMGSSKEIVRAAYCHHEHLVPDSELRRLL